MRITIDDLLKINYEAVQEHIIDFIRGHVNSIGANGAVVGVS